MSLRELHSDGFTAALTRFGVKEAGWAGEVARGTGATIFGRPFETIKQLRAGSAFKPKGILDPHDLLWGRAPPPAPPLAPGASAWDRGAHHLGRFHDAVSPWMQRLFTVGLPAYEAYKGLKGEGDPNENRASNVLGAIGGGLGWAFGMPIGGMLGSGLIASAGRSLGVHAGRLFGGGRPQPPPPPPQPQYQPQYQGNPYVNPQGF